MEEILKQAQKQGDEEFTLTDQESQQLKRAFDDPEFRRMFGEYMQDMQSPQFREESEAYLRELEVQQQIPEGKKLIRPTPKFVVKARRVLRGNREKIFVNVVEHESIAPPKAERKGEGQQWSVPYSLGPVRMEKDKSESNVPTYDCCFHPEALQYAQKSKAFRDLLVKVALDGVKEAAKRQDQEMEVESEYHILKGVAYKSGEVVSMMLGTEEKPAAPASKSQPPQAASQPQTAKAAPKATPKAQATPEPEQLKPVITTQKAAAPAPAAAATKSDKVPEYRIVERGKIDIGGHMEGPAAPELKSTRPTELVVVFELPKVDRAAGLDLDVAERTVKLTYKDVYDVSVPLAYPVIGDQGSAKFDKGKKTLTVTIPVQPAPTELPQRQDVQQSAQPEAQASGDETARTEAEERKHESGAAGVMPATKVDHSRWVQKPEQPAETDPDIQAAKAAAAAHPSLPKPQPDSQAIAKAGALQEFEIHRPSFEFRQNQRTVAVLIQVPGIKEDTVNVEYSGRKVYVSFLAEQPSSQIAERQLSAYWQCLELAGDVNEQECKVDVADRNMLLALTKATQGFWGVTPDTILPPASAAAAPTGGVVVEASEQPSEAAKARLRAQLGGELGQQQSRPSAAVEEKKASQPPAQPVEASSPKQQQAAAKSAPKPKQAAAAAATKAAPASKPVAAPTPNLQLKTDLLFELD